MSTVFGVAPPQVEHDDFNVLQFVIQQWVMNNVNTVKLVRVVACTNSGGVSPVGTVDVLPLVNQMTAQRNPIPHGTLYKLPYLRMQGGASAIILDPVKDDVGVAIFADRDISSLKKALLAANKAQQNPGSFRAYNWADGLYLGGFLNAAPTQYVQFNGTGVTVKAPTIKLDGNVHITGTTTGDGDAKFQGTDVHTHVHSGVQSGGSDTGPPV
jgi:hypothetical protein